MLPVWRMRDKAVAKRCDVNWIELDCSKLNRACFVAQRHFREKLTDKRSGFGGVLEKP